MRYQHFMVKGFAIVLLVAVGYALARAFYSENFLSIILALTSLAAAIYFLYLLITAATERRSQKA